MYAARKGACVLIRKPARRSVSSNCHQAEPGDRILDACVAPGSKYTALHEKYSKEVQIYGLEINPKRMNRIPNPELKRLHEQLDEFKEMLEKSTDAIKWISYNLALISLAKEKTREMITCL